MIFPRFANNPTLFSIRDAFEQYPHAKEYIIVHLGTGGAAFTQMNLKENVTEKWGLLNWVYPAGSIFFLSQDGNVKEAIHVMKLLALVNFKWVSMQSLLC